MWTADHSCNPNHTMQWPLVALTCMAKQEIRMYLWNCNAIKHEQHQPPLSGPQSHVLEQPWGWLVQVLHSGFETLPHQVPSQVLVVLEQQPACQHLLYMFSDTEVCLCKLWPMCHPCPSIVHYAWGLAMVICALHGMHCIRCWPAADIQHQLDVLAEKHHIPAHQQGHQ